MDQTEKNKLKDKIWVGINRVNRIIEDLEKNRDGGQQPDIQELLNALVGVNHSLIDLGKEFDVGF